MIFDDQVSELDTDKKGSKLTGTTWLGQSRPIGVRYLRLPLHHSCDIVTLGVRPDLKELYISCSNVSILFDEFVDKTFSTEDQLNATFG